MALGKILCVLFTRYKHNKSFRLPVSGLVVSIGSTPTKRQTQFLGNNTLEDRASPLPHLPPPACAPEVSAGTLVEPALTPTLTPTWIAFPSS